MAYGRPLWEINMRVEITDHGFSPAYQFTWNIRDAAGGQVSNQTMIAPEAMKYCIVEPGYLLAHCNEQFRKFWQEQGKGFSEILAQSLADWNRRCNPPTLEDPNESTDV